MTNTDPRESTTDRLIDALRRATGRTDLAFASGPSALVGGYWAELLRFTLADAPADLAGDLVARIVPGAEIGAFEAAIQDDVAAQGFPTPAIRLAAPLGAGDERYLIVMDHVDGRPPLAGLQLSTIVSSIPRLMRRLPDQLAEMAARLHQLDPEPLSARLGEMGTSISATLDGFLVAQIEQAVSAGRADLAGAGERLLATEPVTTRRAICHGDLHPFNLLITPDGPVLIDWTVSRIAHPAFDVAFTELLLTNSTRLFAGRAAGPMAPVARRIGARFMARYRALAPEVADDLDERVLGWHRQVHALRMLVELAGWDATGARPAGHPWVILEPVARGHLGLA